MRKRFALLTIIAAFCATPWAMGCFSTPDWIHRLPDEFQGADEMQAGDLPGVYIRPVFTRYSIADPHSFSSATQTIHIQDDGSGIYYKIHTYEQWVRGEASRSIYGEKGKFERKGPWVLLKPFAVYHRSQGPVRMDSEESMRRCVTSLSVTEAMHRLDVRKKIVEGDPLLYFWSEQDQALTPLAYEEEGNIYRFGFYEQLTAPYDSGHMLERSHDDYTLRTQNPHGYFKQGSTFLRNYAADPAWDVQKQMNGSTDCIQELLPIQSSK